MLMGCKAVAHHFASKETGISKDEPLRGSSTKSEEVPELSFFSVQSRQELQEWIKEFIHISQKVELTMNVKGRVYAHQTVEDKKVQTGALLNKYIQSQIGHVIRHGTFHKTCQQRSR
ncbi:hypothetical protein AV530_012207 [Patagioenas fasciata monilis]|uniref:Uncharacterized protein n=1 Tax=Patagioenas fasciata monilis TaxID=372326 RepID=A0A1V4K4W6_PATFA|nr:hypothetical protein AV530_012207 [Patagioenas fasciata monilis]